MGCLHLLILHFQPYITLHTVFFCLTCAFNWGAELTVFISDTHITKASKVAPAIGGSPLFWASKRCFDISLSLFLLPLLAIFAIILLVLNPFGNRGSLFFVQIRMGRDCRAFKAYKFRTMHGVKMVQRGPNDPIEACGITKFGKFLRKTRIDELPQIINVLQGKMSLIGPRPDFFTHARAFVRAIPEYRDRHRIRPGISGLAQVELGYAEGFNETRSKAQTDLYYIRNANFRMELRLIGKTFVTVLTKEGV